MQPYVVAVIIFAFVILPLAYAQSPIVPATHEWHCSQEFQFLCNMIITINEKIQSLTDHLSSLNSDFLQYQRSTDTHLSELDDQISVLQTEAIDRSQIYEVVNLDVNQNTAYCDDLNDILLMGYCSAGVPNESTQTNTVVWDNFNDLDYTNNPIWTVAQGSFAIGNFPSGSPALVGNGGTVYHDIFTPAAVNNIQLTMSMKIMPSIAGDQMYIGLTDSPGPLLLNDTGYMLGAIGGANQLILYRIINGSWTYLQVENSVIFSPGGEYEIKAERDSAGYWKLYYNGIEYDDQVQDVTTTSFSYAHLRYKAPNNDGGAFDDVLIEYGDNSPFTSAFQNISNENSPMGFSCLKNGTARVLCLEQP